MHEQRRSDLFLFWSIIAQCLPFDVLRTRKTTANWQRQRQLLETANPNPTDNLREQDKSVMVANREVKIN